MPSMHRHTFGIVAFLVWYKIKECTHARGCPQVAGRVVAPQTAEHWGSERGRGDELEWIKQPVGSRRTGLTSKLLDTRCRRHQDTWRRLALWAGSNSNQFFVLSQFPLGQCSTCIGRHLLSSLIVGVLSRAPKTLHKKSVTRQRQSTHTQNKAKESHRTR